MKRSFLGLLSLTLALAACGDDAGGTIATTADASTAGTSTTAATTTTTDEGESPTTSSTAGSTATTAAATTTTTSSTAGTTATTATATTTTTSSTTATTTTATTTTTTAVTTTTASGGGTTVTIAAENFAFSPSTVTIRVGDTVQWILRDGSHTTTSGTAPTPDGLWNQVITADAPVSINFDQAGQFRFYCRFHVDAMQGTVVVEP